MGINLAFLPISGSRAMKQHSFFAFYQFLASQIFFKFTYLFKMKREEKLKEKDL
jgi:hypothetical protein